MINIEIKPIFLDSKEFIQILATKLKEKILENVKSSVNNNAEPFAPYSVTSKKTGPVDLNETGRMLSQLNAVVEEKNMIRGALGERAEVAEKLSIKKNVSVLTLGKTLDEVYAETLINYVKSKMEGI